MLSGAPVPDEVATELERVVRRWQQLSVDHALAASADVYALAARLAAATAQLEGRAVRKLPELRPAGTLDQLVVTVHDAMLAGSVEAATLREELVELRRSLP